MALSASDNEIWPVSRTARAPPSMTCQIRIVNLPTCLTVISRKTAARTMTAKYVHEGLEYQKIGLGMALNTFQNDNLERSLRIQATYFLLC